MIVTRTIFSGLFLFFIVMLPLWSQTGKKERRYRVNKTAARENYPGSPLEKADPESAVGISGQWGFTPNLTLRATANPGFFQVEADAV